MCNLGTTNWMFGSCDVCTEAGTFMLDTWSAAGWRRFSQLKHLLLRPIFLSIFRAWPPTVFLWSDLLRRSVKRWQNYLVNTNIHFRNHAQNYATPGVCVSLTEQSKNIRTQQEARFLGDTQHEFTQGEAHCSLLDASTTNRRSPTGSRISLVHVCKLLGDVMNSSLRNINGPKISKHWILSMYM